MVDRQKLETILSRRFLRGARQVAAAHADGARRRGKIVDITRPGYHVSAVPGHLRAGPAALGNSASLRKRLARLKVVVDAQARTAAPHCERLAQRGPHDRSDELSLPRPFAALRRVSCYSRGRVSITRIGVLTGGGTTNAVIRLCSNRHHASASVTASRRPRPDLADPSRRVPASCASAAPFGTKNVRSVPTRDRKKLPTRHRSTRSSRAVVIGGDDAGSYEFGVRDSDRRRPQDIDNDSSA